MNQVKGIVAVQINLVANLVDKKQVNSFEVAIATVKSKDFVVCLKISFVFVLELVQLKVFTSQQWVA